MPKEGPSIDKDLTTLTSNSEHFQNTSKLPLYGSTKTSLIKFPKGFPLLQSSSHVLDCTVLEFSGPLAILGQVIPLETLPYLCFPGTVLPWFSSLITGQSNSLVFSQSSMLVHTSILAFNLFSSISTTHSQGDLTWTLGFKYHLFADDFQIYTLIYLALMSP